MTDNPDVSLIMLEGPIPDVHLGLRVWSGPLEMLVTLPQLAEVEAQARKAIQAHGRFMFQSSDGTFFRVLATPLST